MLLNFHTQGYIEAGCDEAGRGCLAGPVFAAAVILPPDFYEPGLKDSKKMSEKERIRVKEVIEKTALAFAVASVDHLEIDKINILNASILAMHRALGMLKINPHQILVDGNRFKKYQNIPHHCIIKGDGKYASIAAASVLAKTARDEFMEKMDQEAPQYGWKKNKGYATAFHREAIQKYGIHSTHRKSFTLLPLQQCFDF